MFNRFYARTRKQYGPRRSVTRASSRRRSGYGRRRPTYTNWQPSLRKYSSIKKVNKTRSKLALPNLEKKYILIQANEQQWTGKSSTVFSHELVLTKAATGAGRNNRESNNCKFLGSTFRFRINQLVNTEHFYRVFLVKAPQLQTTTPQPNELLSNGITYFKYDTYKINTLRDSNDDFIVIKDFMITMNTNSDRPTEKTFKIKLPAANLLYKDTDTTGEDAKNHLYLFIITDAPETTAGYTISYINYRYFLDQ